MDKTDYIYTPIIKNKGFNPKPVAGNIPFWADSLSNPKCKGTKDWEEWWLEQFYYMDNGYTTGGLHLPGPEYMYLNFLPIKGLHGTIFPDYVDVFHQLFEMREDVKKDSSLSGIIIPKARRIGLSLFGNAICSHGMRFTGDYRFGVAGGLERYVNGFRQKLYMGYNNVPPELKLGHLKRNDTEMLNGYEIKNTQGQFDEFVTSLGLFQTLKDQATKLEGEYFNDVLFEEMGEFPNSNQAYDSIKPALMLGNALFGMFLMYGCVCAGTKVWDNKGNLINIEDLQQKDGILGFDGYGISKEPITYIQAPIKKECYRIITNTGRKLDCSYDHPILWSRKDFLRGTHGKTKKAVKFVKAKDIKPFDQIAVIDNVPLYGNKKMWEPRLVGWLIGDGSYGFNKTPVLSNCDNEINNYVLKNFDCTIEKSYLTKEFKIYQETRIKNICPKLRELGIYGQTKLKKRLPVQIQSYRKKDICELLGGFFDTDGSVNHKKGMQIILTASSYELLFEVQLLLQKLGIHCSINRIKATPFSGKGGTNDYYKLIIADHRSLVQFHKDIKFKLNYKQERLNSIIHYFQNKRIVIRKGKETIMKKEVPGLRFERVISVEPIGLQNIYNLTAGNTNTYIANGIVTHNTGGNMLKGSKAFKEFWHNYESYGLLRFFIPGMRRYHPFYRGAKNEEGQDISNTPKLDAQFPDLSREQLLGCEDVNSAKEDILKERLRRAKNPNKSSLADWNQKYPITVEEVFTSSGFNNFNSDLLYQQQFEIDSNPRKYTEWVLEFVKDSDGQIVLPLKVKARLPKPTDMEWEKVDIYLHPKPNYQNLDVGGFDGYNEDKTTTSDSLGGIVVVRRFDEIKYAGQEHHVRTPILHYLKRPPRKEMHWEMGLKIAVYYNLVKNMMISAESDMVINYFKNNNGKKFLSPRPKEFDSPDSKQSHDYGVKMTGYSKPRLISILQTFIEDSIHVTYFEKLVLNLLAYDVANIGTDWDDADALGYAIMRIIDMKVKPVAVDAIEDRKDFELGYYDFNTGKWSNEAKSNNQEDNSDIFPYLRKKHLQDKNSEFDL